MFAAGFCSGNVVSATVGAALAFSEASAFLMWHVTRESGWKRFLEAASAIGAAGSIVCGYLLTGSVLLAASTVLMFCLMFIAFLLSYVLPKIREKRSLQKPV